MAYIIMGKDECNQEFRPAFENFDTEEEAYAVLDEAWDRYPEARTLWVEMLRDKDYYLQKHQDDDEDWEWEYL